MTKIKKYLPDTLVLAGIYIYLNGVPLFGKGSGLDVELCLGDYIYCHLEEIRSVGILLVALGVIIAIRRFLATGK